MSFGPDIKELLKELGVSYTILRDSGNITGEYLIYKVNRQATKPFVREYFFEATVAHDSVLVQGDILQFVDNRAFLVVSDTPRMFEGSTFDNKATLYRCNVSGELFRFSGESYNDQTYQRTNEFNSIKDPCYGLLIEEMYGNYLDQDSVAGQVENRALVFYLPASAGIQPLDRVIPISGEVFKVEEVDKFTFLGVHIAHLEKDER